MCDVHGCTCAEVGIQLRKQISVFFGGSFQSCTVDSDFRCGDGRILCTRVSNRPEFDAGHVFRIISVEELTTHVLKVEVHVYQSVVTIHHVAVFLLVHAEVETLLGVLHRSLREQHEDFVCFVIIQRLGFRILNGGVHFQSGHSGWAGRMLHRVPFFAAVGILLFQFLQRGQFINVSHYHVNIGTAGKLLCRNVLTGEVVKLVKYLLLESSESGLDGFGLAVVRHRGFVKMAEFLEESLRSQLLVSSLVIGHYLVRLHLPCLQCHPVRHVLVVEVFAVADKVAEEQFRAGIHHFVHIRCSCHPSLLSVIVRTVVKVYLRTV